MRRAISSPPGSSDRQGLLRSHPVSDRARRRQGRSAPDQCRQRHLAARQIGAEAGGLHQAYRTHRRRLRRAGHDPALQGRGPPGLRRAAVRPLEPALRPLRSRPQGPRQALRAPRLHQRRCRSAAALSALHPRRGRQRGPAAQHLARDAAEEPAGGADPQGRHGPVLGELETLAAKDAAAFAKVWDAFGSVLKEGIYEDPERRDQLLALARFTTTKDGGIRSLADYVADLKPNQTDIYYLVGDSIERLKSSPKLEAARAAASRCCCSPIRSMRSGRRAAGLPGQAAEVAEPGRRRFRPCAPARAGRGARGQGRTPSTMPSSLPRSKPRSASASPTCAPRSG